MLLNASAYIFASKVTFRDFIWSVVQENFQLAKLFLKSIPDNKRDQIIEIWFVSVHKVLLKVFLVDPVV